MLRYLTAVRELELANARVEELKQERDNLLARLLSEIDSNRNREDALVAQFTKGHPLPMRRLLAVQKEQEATEEEEPDEPVIHLDGEVDETEVDRIIRMRAMEYWEQAYGVDAQYGEPFEAYVEQCKASPNFLEN